ncbi:glycosyltransferase family 4 protein [Roseomonas sp. SSH11]|uniref:Glycosyltransferase family 4 protein n=1 Tax=Pararoseomonas baculiformis TaxID=2820812 RepID=A0ABS4AEK2_9PROT|nr:glycosyltransferase family 4 protein [Pararoseomonas baculiformis]MBP0445430.1 glycosyltransferase family 4 protein [Pararoseomonas baculiformis]
MRIGLITAALPLAGGAHRLILEGLREQLVARGHEVEPVWLPFDATPGEVLPQMAAFRMVRLDGYFDRVITLRAPAHAVAHRRKVVWFTHPLRSIHEPEQEHGHARALRAAVTRADAAALRAAHAVLAGSEAAREILYRDKLPGSGVLPPPLPHPERLRAGPLGDEVVVIARMAPWNRQHLLLEALALTQGPLRLRLCGTASDPAYPQALRDAARRLGIADRVTIEPRWITEEEKANLLENALAVATLPRHGNGHAYPVLEAAQAARPILTTTDAGEAADAVADGETGLVTSPDPASLAQALDRLQADRALAVRLGAAARARAAQRGTGWDAVVERLLA